MTDKNIDSDHAAESSNIKNQDCIIDKPNFFIGLIDLIKAIFK